MLGMSRTRVKNESLWENQEPATLSKKHDNETNSSPNKQNYHAKTVHFRLFLPEFEKEENDQPDIFAGHVSLEGWYSSFHSAVLRTPSR